MSSRFPFPAYPNGWFAIGFSADFPVGQVVTRRALGQEIVVYRGQSGAVRATDPYCPHLGAHLGHGGKVEGDHLRCPFHGWCFDGKGRCVDVPGATRIPRAELYTFPIAEENGVVFIHHHARRAPPTYEPPRLPTEGWTEDRTVLWTVRTHPQEVFENVVDAAHLTPIHGCRRASFMREPRIEGHRFDIALNLIANGAVIGMPGIENDVILDVTIHGLGMAVVHTEVRNVPGIFARQRIYCTPIDEERTEIRGAVSVRDMGDDLVSGIVAELFYHAYVVDFAMDFPVWENKIYRDKPILSSADGPFMQYRRWARRFYGAEDEATAASISA